MFSCTPVIAPSHGVLAVLIAVAIKRTGEREVVGVDVGPAEDLE
jgi:transposase-like protein